MTGRTHILGGLDTLCLLAPLPTVLTSQNIVPLSFLALLGALLPDLDAEFSLLHRLRIGDFAPFAPLSALAHRTWGHRGLLHSLPGLLLFLLPAALLALLLQSPVAGVALWLGYASHLALDACTKTGIPLAPNTLRRLWLLPPPLRLVTGSAAEDLLLLPLALPYLALLLRFSAAFFVLR